MGISQYGVPFGGPHIKDYSISGSILGSPYFGKLPSLWGLGKGPQGLGDGAHDDLVQKMAAVSPLPLSSLPKVGRFEIYKDFQCFLSLNACERLQNKWPQEIDPKDATPRMTPIATPRFFKPCLCLKIGH